MNLDVQANAEFHLRQSFALKGLPMSMGRVTPWAIVFAAVAALQAAPAAAQNSKPDILVIWGDDIGTTIPAAMVRRKGI
jgi:hypothetical protein